MHASLHCHPVCAYMHSLQEKKLVLLFDCVISQEVSGKKDSLTPLGYMSVSASVLPGHSSVKGSCRFIILQLVAITKEKSAATRQLGIMLGQ